MTQPEKLPSIIGQRALSRKGHAAMSMTGGDNSWIDIQQNTFTNWVNDNLSDTDYEVKDLQTDFSDGIKLCALVEILQNKKISKVMKKPSNQHQMLHNVGMALMAISKDKVKLVNIGPEDIVNGNMKLILGLVWSLILRYQIGQSGIPPKKLMLAWLQAVIPECNITNFSKDWNSGVALHALIEYCKPGTCPNWKQLNNQNSLVNCTSALNLAKDQLGIPLVLRPEDLCSQELDELSGMTYLSYYMRLNSPGYFATLNWVRNTLKDNKVSNFTTDWTDGDVLARLVKTLGGESPNTSGTNQETLQSGIDCASRLGVEPLLSSKEMVNPEVDHLGIMAYAARFSHLKPTRPTAERVTLAGDFKNVQVGKPKEFTLEITDDDVSPQDLRVEVIGPDSKPLARLDWHGKHVSGNFVPSEAGHHKFVVYYKNQVVSGCPVSFRAAADRSKVKFIHSGNASVGASSELKVDTIAAGEGDVRVEVVTPNGRRHELPVSSRNGVCTAHFKPQEAGIPRPSLAKLHLHFGHVGIDRSLNSESQFPETYTGEHRLFVYYDGEEINGSPFVIYVQDPSLVRVFGLEGGAVGKAIQFTADCSKAGDGDLHVEITHNGQPVYANIHEEGYKVYKVDFTPEGAGLYKVKMSFGDIEVKGSPFTVEIVDSSLVTASGDGLGLVPAHQLATFNVDTSAAGGGPVKVEIESPRGQFLPVRIIENRNDIYRVEYTPVEPGDHDIKVSYYGRPIRANPFQVKVYDAGRVIVHEMPRYIALGQPVIFDIDASEAGSGNLEIMVNGGRVPCNVENKGKRKFVAAFVPENSQAHVVEMKFNGVPVAGSPWNVDVHDERKVTVSKNNLKLVPSNKIVSFFIETDGIPSHDLDVIVKAPSGQQVSSRLYPEQNGYRVEYTPTEVGTYSVQILFAGSAVAGTPFTVKSYDSASIDVSHVPNGAVGEPVDFFIDVTTAGEGQLEIMVNNGSLPNTVTQQRPGVYKVTFIPLEPITHYIDVRFNGERLPGAPYTCHVIDSSRVNVEVHRLAPVRQSSHFVIQSQSVTSSGIDTTDLACVVEITASNGRVLPVRLTKSRGSCGTLNGEFIPLDVGRHEMHVMVNDHMLEGSPVLLDCFDAGLVQVTDMADHCFLGEPFSAMVYAATAGVGNLSVSIMSEGGHIVSALTQPWDSSGVHKVSHMPTDSGQHMMEVTFNEQEVPGSPFMFEVIDLSSITLTGAGIDMVPVQTSACFNVESMTSEMASLTVQITGPESCVPQVHKKQISPGVVDISYIPQSIGQYIISLWLHGRPLIGCPFMASAFDPGLVTVTKPCKGCIGKPVTFQVDKSLSGVGKLEVSITHDDEVIVPYNLKSVSAVVSEVLFLPEYAGCYTVTVLLNDIPVSGTPFSCIILDYSKISIQMTDEAIPANQRAAFSILIQSEFGSQPELSSIQPIVQGPDGQRLACHMTENLTSWGTFKAEFTPLHVGDHSISLKYDDMIVPDTHLSCSVFDPYKVQILHHTNSAYINTSVTWTVSVAEAGAGALDISVKCGKHSVDIELVEIDPCVYQLSFVPKEMKPHIVMISFSNHIVPGFPFCLEVMDSRHVTATGKALNLAQVGIATTFEVDAQVNDDEDLSVCITDSRQTEVSSVIEKSGSTYHVTFTPHAPGNLQINVLYANLPIKGSPFTCMTFDPSLVVITKAENPMLLTMIEEFIVDAANAGSGHVDLKLLFKNQDIKLHTEQLSQQLYRCTFTPEVAGDYQVIACFNDIPVPCTPFMIPVAEREPMHLNVKYDETLDINYQKNSYLMINACGKTLCLDDVNTNAIAPNDELIPCRIIQQPDHDYRVEWTPTIPGRYTIDVLFGGRKIQGSPFYVDVFDISCIRFDSVKIGSVGDTASFKVDFSGAGTADYALHIVGPNGNNVPYELEEKGEGIRITFHPTEAGRYKVFMTYGNMDVPGSPLVIDVDEGRMPSAYGDGLYKAEEGTAAVFYVDAQGLRGELSVQVDGPNSIAKCNVDPDNDGTYAVTYVPVEVGMYNIQVRWNNKEIQGSPFHPKIVDGRQVHVIGGWQHYMDNKERVHVIVNEEKHLPFDVKDAGPGNLTAEVRGPSGKIPVHIEAAGDNKRTVTFTATEEGDYYIYVYWSDHAIVGSPFHAYARFRRVEPDPTKVILSGRGLTEARVTEKAEFVIDGTEAGQGKPDVRLQNVHGTTIPVQIAAISTGRFRCTYTAEDSGSYLLYINWNNRQLRGSPFKVNILPSHHPEKVIVTGEGLQGGVMGKDINVVIDTRRAGPGELTAHCMGPHKVAYCELEDMRDGTYRLNIRPQEPGRHILQIKYGGHHVLGSPYVLKIAAQPDASKVRVSGPGVEHGMLAMYQSRFMVETRGAGAGQLTVRIRGPKGAFQVEMMRDSQKDRTILCQFHPTECGLYVIYIKWSGMDVPGSPFSIHIVDSVQEYNRIMSEGLSYNNQQLNRSGYGSGYGSWREEM